MQISIKSLSKIYFKHYFPFIFILLILLFIQLSSQCSCIGGSYSCYCTRLFYSCYSGCSSGCVAVTTGSQDDGNGCSCS